ncbi:uncharacterized protein LOC119395190 [Rhipicephalus sanguineus]|uniref:uncharacterized protein LOC119395190 n=1 Tax=Rhipicephalus sanguineus TaxID=34632 RepID=UPI001895C677|nr:uncharacterized protein LOC119395190 [Rhipicephalus sanguineus]
MATGGMQAAIEPFSGKNWSSWIQRLTFYFVANDVCDEQKKRALLLTLCGADTFETACALVAPKTPEEVGYTDIVALLQKHFDPRLSELYSRYVFQRRDQRPEESISNYFAALRSLSADCNFGVPATTSATSTPPAEGHAAVLANPTMLPQDVMLRDRFVCGIRDEHLQQRLFAEKDLTFQRALDLALSSESASKQQRGLKGATSSGEVHKTSQSKKESKHSAQQRRCYRCDGWHEADTCKFRTAQCRFCSKKGHIENACISKKKKNKEGNLNARQGTHMVNAQPVCYDLEDTDRCYDLHAMKGTGCNLLGRDWFSALNIRVHGINQVAEPSQEIQEVLALHPDVFKEGIDGYVGPLVHLDLEEGATPKFCKARPVPLAYQEPMEEELDRLQKEGILGPTQHAEMATPLVATVAAELYVLLERNTPWKWEKKHQDAFEMLKKMIRSSTVLAHYDEKRPLILSVDASPYGIGAILAQKDAFGREAPIAFASRTLGTAEKNYSQLDKEGLAVVYGVSHFHQYVAGRHVTVLTDHQPLLGIMGEKKQIPQILSPRMTRWCLKLATYDYDLVYRPGRLHQNADALSRLPLPAQVDEPCSPGDVLMLASAPRFELSPRQLAELTRNDPLLSRVMTAVANGELRRLPKQEFSAFTKLGHELSLQEGCVIRGARLVVPEKARKDVLDLAHAGHRGVVDMKACARGYFWWPGVDNDIERVVKSCATCCQYQKTPTKAPAPEWKRATTPWHTIHADFAGPVEGRMLLIVVDAYSKWLEVRTMRNIQSPTLIEELRNLFATFGIPERRKRRRRMICPQRPTPSIAKLRPGWTLVRRKLAMTNPAGPRSTKVRLGPNVIGVHLTDPVTPSKG